MNNYCEFEKLIENKKNNQNFYLKKIKLKHNTTITRINLKKIELVKKLKKNFGYYSTIHCMDYDYLSNYHFDFLTEKLIKELKNVLKKINFNISNPKIFIVGLGNTDIIADSLGTKVVNGVLSTSKDIESGNISKENFGNISTIAPSISSKNGIYTFEIVKALTKSLNPDLIILIDSLSCKKINYLAKTFQINTYGLTPGCEIGNKQPSITKETLFNKPVIAIGCPLVINLENITNQFDLNLTLTLKDIDIAVEKCADIISFSLNRLFHPKLSKSEIIYLTKQ